MGFFSRRRIQRAVRSTMERMGRRPRELDPSAISALMPGEQADAWALVAEALVEADADPAPVHSALDRALAVDPECWEAWSTRAQIEQRTPGRRRQAMAALEKLHSLEPGNEAVRVDLAVLLLETGEHERALGLCEALEDLTDMELGLRLGQALFAAGLNERAVELLGPLRRRSTLALRQLGLAEPSRIMQELLQEIGTLHDEAYAELHGREAVVVGPALEGRLDGSEPVNFTLLGESLMVESPALTHLLRLQAPEEEQARGHTLLERGEEARGRVLLGSALLRWAQADAAELEFERACRADGRNFAAFLGLGTAMEAQRIDVVKRIDALGKLPDDLPGLQQVVCDWPVLTGLERRVVIASAAPLGLGLKAVGDRAHPQPRAQIRLLPVDVRPTDLPELAEHTGEVSDDHRTIDAIGGLTTERVACARIIDLLNIEAERGWTFAHELAHLVFFHLHDELREPVLRLYKKSLRAGYVFDTYTVTSVEEFFAGAYEDYLQHRYGCKLRKELDDQGILAATFDYFDGLG